MIADAFPLLNALKDVHLILAEGAHNQFGDLTWTARAEMMTIQWMLARPEMREFLRGRYMVPYQEEWMGAVDSMKKLQGWTDTTITHFYELAVTGERILALNPLWRLVRYREHRGSGEELGPLLQAGDPALHLRLPDGHRASICLRRSWTRATRRRDICSRPCIFSAGSRSRRRPMRLRAPAAPDLLDGENVGADRGGEGRPAQIAHLQEGKLERGGSTMLDFTSALYLGFRHAHDALRPWAQLTTGRPAALEPAPEAVALAQDLARLLGCERAVLAPSTLHLFWDLFDVLARDRIAIYTDAGTYPIARYGVERAAAKGVPTSSFLSHDPAASGIASAA